MLVVKMKGWGLNLDKKMGQSQGATIWEFNRSANSYWNADLRQPYRYARITPADPKDGKTVEVVLMQSPSAPEETWVSKGQGVVSVKEGV